MESKKEILSRLHKEGHITIDELLELIKYEETKKIDVSPLTVHPVYIDYYSTVPKLYEFMVDWKSMPFYGTGSPVNDSFTTISYSYIHAPIA